MKTATMTFLMAAALAFGLAAHADEATKPAVPAAKAATTTKPATKAQGKAEAPAAAPAIPEKAKIDWDKMNKAERKTYMKSTVLPAAKKMFAAYDAKKYSKVTCATCHGPGAADGSFKMPNAELPKLPKTAEGFKELNEKKPEMMKFMGQTVKPTVAALLGQQPWMPDNPKGFGCNGCHENVK